MTYYLPRGATQGPDSWYLLRLHFRLELAENSAPGLVYVSVSTNDRTAAQVKFQLYRVGGLIIHWDTVDLLEGEEHFFTLSPSIEVFFSNYLQTAGVLPGLNTLTVSLEAYDGAKVNRLVVFDDSGIEYTPLGPPKLTMQVILPDKPVIVGDVFRIGFELGNRGGYPAKGVTVQAAYPQDAIRIRDIERWHFPTVEKETKGEFVLESLQSGHYEITLFVTSESGGRPAAAIEANIGEIRSDQKEPVATGVPLWMPLLSMLLAGISILLLTKSFWIRK
ncbi:MAG: hypothetical protein KGJ80_13810 [Chloroflexota bacterium]|nr:hypothetical protein [Chloroflexota bacterium]